MNDTKNVVVIGGGAAGVFGAIQIKEQNPDAHVVILEKTQKLLSKVKISGGGRCNVTHHQFEPKKLAQSYPRGSMELIGPFHQFQPTDMIAWLESKNVLLKVEDDGRMFPTTDSSQTIIDCFLKTLKALDIEVIFGQELCAIHQKEDSIEIVTQDQTYQAACCLIATGSNHKPQNLLKDLGVNIIEHAPSLFTFDLPNCFLLEIPGTVFPHAKLTIKDSCFSQLGPVLVTHVGISGPATLKLSAFAARDLKEKNYSADLILNVDATTEKKDKVAFLMHLKNQYPQKQISSITPFQMTKNCYLTILKYLQIDSSIKFGHLRHETIEKLANFLNFMPLKMEGKSTYKEEFVTAGGVDKKEINFKTMEHKVLKRLFFAGEVIDIDGITGGYNFQNAWTTAYLSALGMKNYLQPVECLC
jgi:predicted Rossmann fold flavoprotein